MVWKPFFVEHRVPAEPSPLSHQASSSSETSVGSANAGSRANPSWSRLRESGMLDATTLGS